MSKKKIEPAHEDMEKAEEKPKKATRKRKSNQKKTEEIKQAESEDKESRIESSSEEKVAEKPEKNEAEPEKEGNPSVEEPVKEPVTADDGKEDDTPKPDAAEKENRAKNEEGTEKAARDSRPRPAVKGILDLADEGFGFLRFENYLTSDKDIYVSPTQIRRFNLKTGDEIFGISRLPNEGEKFGALLYVNTVNGEEPGKAIARPDFKDLTPIFPDERLTLENGNEDLSARLIDLVAPIGKGQRGLIVSPPKAGKTTLLKRIANSLENNYPDLHLLIFLVDERPEEVTDMKRSLKDESEVIYSTFDERPQNHIKVAEMVLARARRLAEHKKDVVILLDSITRLARAYNLVEPPSGRTLSGGLDPSALYKPKKFFGTARNIEEGGSITILATALVETGSRMDDVIYEEFKGTGNMELVLDRELSEKRIFPAININRSSTRKEELLLTEEEKEAMYAVRSAMANKAPTEVTESVLDNLSKTSNNRNFVQAIQKVML
jgi:transcription termination factor Rho